MFSHPDRNIEQLGLSKGMKVADFGAGSGFYALSIAKAVSSEGRVYAIDVQRDLLERLRNEAARRGFHNVEVIAGDVERLGGSKLRDGSCDVCVASNILFSLDNRKGLIAEARRILKDGGRLLVIDWSASFSGMGPHPKQVLYKDDALQLGKESGFGFEREINAGTHHYGIIFRKQ